MTRVPVAGREAIAVGKIDVDRRSVRLVTTQVGMNELVMLANREWEGEEVSGARSRAENFSANVQFFDLGSC